MKYLFYCLIFNHATINAMDYQSPYQFNSQDKSKRFPVTDKKIFNGQFDHKSNVSLFEVLELPKDTPPDAAKDLFLSQYNRLKAKRGPAHRDVKLLKLMGIEHRLLDEDGEPIEYGEPIILPDEEADITQGEAISFIERNEAPPRTHIIQLEQHHIEHPEWVDYMPAFLKLAYGWWKEG